MRPGIIRGCGRTLSTVCTIPGIGNREISLFFSQKFLDKVATGYSSSERAFIRAVGMTAFNITMQKLIDDEKARNNGNGDDK